MDDFEIRYNAVETANLLMMQRLLVELARLHGDKGEAVIERFRNAVVTELNDAKEASTDQPRLRAITEMAQSVVTNVAAMAKDRYGQMKDEGSL